MTAQHELRGVARIQTAEWCLARLCAVSVGLLSGHDERPRGRTLRVSCLAERDDVVFVLQEQVELTWALVWCEATIQVTGTSADGLPWSIRAHGICERERLPAWAALSWARATHPASGGSPPSTPPLGLRLREASMRGYAVLPEERAAG